MRKTIEVTKNTNAIIIQGDVYLFHYTHTTKQNTACEKCSLYKSCTRNGLHTTMNHMAETSCFAFRDSGKGTFPCGYFTQLAEKPNTKNDDHEEDEWIDVY